MKKYKKIIIIFIIIVVSTGLFAAGYFIRGYVQEKDSHETGQDTWPFADYGEHKAEAFVSIINLIATPEKYDGSRVFVNGVLRCEFESDRLYLSKYDYDMRISENAIYLDLYDLSIDVDTDTLRELNGKYVSIEGVFITSSSCISDINRLIYIGDPETGRNQVDIIKEINKDAFNK